MGNAPSELAAMVATGIFAWTLVEYTLHGFLFHIKTKIYWGNTAHYLLHGCHHKHPMDGLRLVFPPAATAILTVSKYHLNLHFRVQTKGFGMTSTVWDIAFGALPPSKIEK